MTQRCPDSVKSMKTAIIFTNLQNVAKYLVNMNKEAIQNRIIQKGCARKSRDTPCFDHFYCHDLRENNINAYINYHAVSQS